MACACLGLREVVGAVVEALVDSEKLLSAINVLAEVHIVYLINISLVHVAAENGLKNVLGCTDSQQVKNAQELILGHVAVARDIVVLEDRLEVDALVLDGGLVLLKNHIHFAIVLVAS